MFYVLLILLGIAVFVEGTMTSLPLVLVCLLCLTIMRRDASVFLFAVISGIVLDVLSLRPIGSSSLFFVLFIFLLLLYQRKYEIDSYPFVAASTFFGSMIFLALFGGQVVIESFISMFIGLGLFAITRISLRKKKIV